jgi:glycosyltransferase involved in cell wall biosynthesis
MRIALIESESTAAPDAASSLHLARALRDRGHAVTFVVPQTTLQPSQPVRAVLWPEDGFTWIPVSAGHLPQQLERFPRDPWLVTARALAPVLRPFDVAWFLDMEWAMPLLRERRFSTHPLPLVVADGLPLAYIIPHSLDELNRIFARNYTLQWADLTCQPDTPLADRIATAEARWQQLAFTPPRSIPPPATTPAVTVCMAYFEEPDFLAEALLSLENQTSSNFTVVVVDDGSHTPQARAVFDACAQRYAPRGWQFLRQTNQYAGATKNSAARAASTEFLLFLDADDIAMPNMVERFLRGALLSGDDCLVAPNYGFRDDPNGPCEMLYDPPGNNLVASMGDDMHGAGCIFIRRSAFQQLGGFTELRGLSFDDYELHIRANLAGLRWDVLPEFIYRYRMPRAQGVSRSTSAYANLARVTRWYRALLQPAEPGQSDLADIPLAFASVYWGLERAGQRARDLEHTLYLRKAKRSPQGREIKLLLLACNFPFGLSSGWHNRIQQMIRYFGSRYQLTLMTAMPHDQLVPVRRQTFRHLHAVLGVEGSDLPAPTASDTPFRVREHYTEVFQAAVRALPSDQYHAALLDQIFMAEFRHDLDTLPVLTEHNIESTLLRQASRNTWNEAEIPLHYRNALHETALLERYEDLAWRDFPLRAAVSEQDRAVIDSRTPTGQTVLAPNGADPDTWLKSVRFQSQTVLFTGHLAYLPNIDAVDFLLSTIWPLVRQRNPRARLLLAGRDPSPLILAAIARAGAATAGIELCASPASMDAVAARASVSIAPLRLGSGTRLKILDSMAWGLPVVSTTLGAEGIAATDQEHILLRDDPTDFAEAILRLLTDEPLWQRLRANSAALIRERYAWDRVFTPLEDALLELIP